MTSRSGVTRAEKRPRRSPGQRNDNLFTARVSADTEPRSSAPLPVNPKFPGKCVRTAEWRYISGEILELATAHLRQPQVELTFAIGEKRDKSPVGRNRQRRSANSRMIALTLASTAASHSDIPAMSHPTARDTELALERPASK